MGYILKKKQKKTFTVMEECLFSLPPSQWMNKATRGSEVADSDIYIYITESPGVDINVSFNCPSLSLRK